MDSAYKVLQQSLQKKGLKKQTKASEHLHAINQWLQTCSPAIANATTATSVTKDELTLRVENALAAQELQAVLADLQHYLEQGLQLDSVRIVQRRK